MKRFFLIAVFAVLACDVRPQSDMERWARSALKCPTGALTWSVVEPNGGTIDQAGNYLPPGCPTPYVDATYHVRVAGCGQSVDIPVAVKDEDVSGLSVYCGVVLPETCCRLPPITVPPAGQIQFYAQFQYSCAGHVTYSPAPPPPLCL